MKLYIVYDNEATEGFEAAWGFSCLVENGSERVLFDTGGEARKLKHNMDGLGIRKETIGNIVISHDHWDHTGGLSAVVHPKAVVYLPAPASRELRAQVGKAARVVEVTEPVKIAEGVHSTGTLGGVENEQSLVLETGKGALIISGCAHPGLVNIVESGKRWGRIWGVIGGFHGFSDLPFLEKMGLIGPCHCTAKKEEILRKYPKTCIRPKAGLVFEF
jgi:7,8-dihydropterin-6-yl-methyl-4-(beta-D-ribofuranosyl)aminobenzene 5'-phosphate synthase